MNEKSVVEMKLTHPASQAANLNSEIWIDIKTLAEIKNVTSRGIRLALPKSKIKTGSSH